MNDKVIKNLILQIKEEVSLLKNHNKHHKYKITSGENKEYHRFYLKINNQDISWRLVFIKQLLSGEKLIQIENTFWIKNIYYQKLEDTRTYLGY